LDIIVDLHFRGKFLSIRVSFFQLWKLHDDKKCRNYLVIDILMRCYKKSYLYSYNELIRILIFEIEIFNGKITREFVIFNHLKFVADVRSVFAVHTENQFSKFVGVDGFVEMYVRLYSVLKMSLALLFYDFSEISESNTDKARSIWFERHPNKLVSYFNNKRHTDTWGFVRGS
jgi:hypothetical protein